MAFEEHKNKKFQYGNPYADYEYVNKNSRKTGPGLILSILFAIAMFVFAWWRFGEISSAEEIGGTIKLTSIEWGLYKLGGKWCIISLFILLGGFFLFAGIRNFQRLEKIRKS